MSNVKPENLRDERDEMVQMLCEHPIPVKVKVEKVHRCEFLKETAVEVARMNRELVTWSLMKRKEEDIVMEINCVIADYQQALMLEETEVAHGLRVELMKWQKWAEAQEQA